MENESNQIIIDEPISDIETDNGSGEISPISDIETLRQEIQELKLKFKPDPEPEPEPSQSNEISERIKVITKFNLNPDESSHKSSQSLKREVLVTKLSRKNKPLIDSLNDDEISGAFKIFEILEGGINQKTVQPQPKMDDNYYDINSSLKILKL